MAAWDRFMVGVGFGLIWMTLVLILKELQRR